MRDVEKENALRRHCRDEIATIAEATITISTRMRDRGDCRGSNDVSGERRREKGLRTSSVFACSHVNARVVASRFVIMPLNWRKVFRVNNPLRTRISFGPAQ